MASKTPIQSTTFPRHQRFSAQLCLLAMRRTSLALPLFSVTPALVEERCRLLVFLPISTLDQPAHLFLANWLPLAHLEHHAQQDRAQGQQLGEDDPVGRLRAIAFGNLEDCAPAPLAQADAGLEGRRLHARVLDFAQLGSERTTAKRFHWCLRLELRFPAENRDSVTSSASGGSHPRTAFAGSNPVRGDVSPFSRCVSTARTA